MLLLPKNIVLIVRGFNFFLPYKVSCDLKGRLVYHKKLIITKDTKTFLIVTFIIFFFYSNKILIFGGK